MLSPYGIRSLSRRHLAEPFSVRRRRRRRSSVDYEPAESRSDVRRQLQLARAGVVPRQLPRGRGARALPRLPRADVHGGVPDRLRHGDHARRGRRRAARPAGRAVPARTGRASPGLRRPSGSAPTRAGRRPLFFEYFDGDDGCGLGASHQTGWTGLVADLVRGLPLAADSPSASDARRSRRPTCGRQDARRRMPRDNARRRRRTRRAPRRAGSPSRRRGLGASGSSSPSSPGPARSTSRTPCRRRCSSR